MCIFLFLLDPRPSRSLPLSLSLSCIPAGDKNNRLFHYWLLRLRPRPPRPLHQKSITTLSVFSEGEQREISLQTKGRRKCRPISTLSSSPSSPCSPSPTFDFERSFHLDSWSALSPRRPPHATLSFQRQLAEIVQSDVPRNRATPFRRVMMTHAPCSPDNMHTRYRELSFIILF